MNERIEALKKLATKEVWGNNPHNGSPEFDGYELDADMFAELIVRECMLICGAIQGAAELKNMSEFASGAAQCEAIIKRDFGVKE